MSRLSQKAHDCRLAIQENLQQFANQLREPSPWRAAWLVNIAETLDNLTDLRCREEFLLEFPDCEAELLGI